MHDNEVIKALELIKVCPLCNKETVCSSLWIRPNQHIVLDTDVKAECSCGFRVLCWKVNEEDRSINMGTRKQAFVNEYYDRGGCNTIVVAIQLPTGAVEIITNTVQINTKIEYYDKAYDDYLCLKANPAIKIIDWIMV